MEINILIQQMGVIAVLVGIGVYLYKKGTITDDNSKSFSAMVVDVCNPALIMASVLGGNITASRHSLLVSIGLGFALYAFLIAAGFCFPLLLRVKKDDRRFYNLMTVYTNIGFIGIPVARAILPDNAMLTVIVSNVIYCLLFYTHGVVMLSRGREKMNLRKLLNPGTVMAVLTLLVFWFDIKLPVIAANSVTYIGNATTLLSMCMLGAAIARSDIKEGLRDKRLFVYVAIRMVLFPLALAFLMSSLGADKDMTLAFAMLMSMPVGNLPLIQAEKTGEDTTIFSRYIMMTTLVMLFTTTLVISLVNMIIN